MMPNIDPRQMQQMMRKMGISQTELDADEVIIRLKDKDIVLSNPSVTEVNMSGQKNYQISGRETIRARDGISDDDIQTVVDQTGVSAAEAKKSLQESDGDIAKAILSLKEEE